MNFLSMVLFNMNMFSFIPLLDLQSILLDLIHHLNIKLLHLKIILFLSLNFVHIITILILNIYLIYLFLVNHLLLIYQDGDHLLIFFNNLICLLAPIFVNLVIFYLSLSNKNLLHLNSFLLIKKHSLMSFYFCNENIIYYLKLIHWFDTSYISPSHSLASFTLELLYNLIYEYTLINRT